MRKTWVQIYRRLTLSMRFDARLARSRDMNMVVALRCASLDRPSLPGTTMRRLQRSRTFFTTSTGSRLVKPDLTGGWDLNS